MIPSIRCILLILFCLFFMGNKAEAEPPSAVPTLPPEVGALCLEVIDGAVWVGTSGGLYRETDAGLVRVGRFDQAVWDIVPLRGQVWVVTTRGAARVDGDEVRTVPTPPVDVRNILALGDTVWLFTDRDVWEVTAGLDCRRLIDQAVFFPKLESDGKETWIKGLFAGAYQVKPGTPWSEVTLRPEVTEVEAGPGRTWLGTMQGLLELVDGKVRRRHLQGQPIHWVKAWNGVIWLLAGKSLYRIGDGRLKRIVTLKNRASHDIAEAGGNLWLIGNETFRIDASNKFQKLPGIDEFQYPRTAPDGTVYLFRNVGGEVLAFKDGGIQQCLGEDELGVMQVEETDRSLWVLSADGAWRLENGMARKVCPDAGDYTAVSEGPQGTWLISRKGAFWIEAGAACRLPDRELHVLDMVQTSSAAWIATVEGDLLRVRDGRVDTLTVPLPEGALTDPLLGKSLRFTGKVREILPLKDHPGFLTFELKLDVEFRNDSDRPVFLVDGSPTMKHWEYWVSGATLATSPEASRKGDFLFSGPGGWPSDYRGPDWLAFRACLSTPAPSGTCLRRLDPGESFSFSSKVYLNWPGSGQIRKGLYPSDTLWLQVDVESWPINLGYGYQTKVATGLWHDAFRLMLQRRWLKEGRLPPMHMRSEPMPIDLSPWATP